MIDTHCHLTDPRLRSQLDGVLNRAQAAGVTRMITIGVTLADAAASLELCDRVPNLRCAIGVHPNHSHEVEPTDLPQLRGLQNHPAVLALGEMGLDYHYEFSPRDRQRTTLEFQLQLATELKRKVVIHCREATDDCLAIMAGFPSVGAVFHCFTAGLVDARKILDAGHMLGFTGPVSYKKSDELRAVAAMVPEDRFVVETDAPYLSPEPMRKQKTNEPALVIHTAQAIAAVRKKRLEEIDQITTTNAERFFGWSTTSKH